MTKNIALKGSIYIILIIWHIFCQLFNLAFFSSPLLKLAMYAFVLFFFSDKISGTFFQYRSCESQTFYQLSFAIFPLPSHQFLLVISIEKLDWRSRQLLRHRPSDLGKEVAAMPKQSSLPLIGIELKCQGALGIRV